MEKLYQNSKVLLSVLIIFTLSAMETYGATWETEEYLRNIARDFSPTELETVAGATILQKTVEHDIVDINRPRTTVHIIGAILDSQASEDFSRISHGYNAYFSNLELIEARVLLPSGEIAVPSEDAIQTRTAGSADNYSSQMELQFSFPGLKPGSIFEYVFQISSIKTVVENEWWSTDFASHFTPTRREISFRIDPVRKSAVTYKTPANVSLNFKSLNAEDVSPVVKNSSNGRMTTYIFENLPAKKVETAMRSFYGELPIIQVSTMSSWNELDGWLQARYRLAPSKRIQQLAESLVTGLTSKEEKVRAIYEYLQKNLRYISADFRANGVIPDSPETVLENEYGDCKDQSTLFVSLLSAVGIDAAPVLINPRNGMPVHNDLPNLSFSHMIVHVPGLKEGAWIDLVGERARFPGMDSSYYSRPALAVTPAGARVLNTSDIAEVDDKLDIQIEFDLSVDPIKMSIELSGEGAMSRRLKHFYSVSSPDRLRQLFQTFYQNAKLQKVMQTGKDDPTAPFSANADFIVEDAWNEDNVIFSGGAVQVLRAFSNINILQKDDNRQSEFQLLVNHRFEVTYRFVNENSNYELVTINPGVAGQNDAFSVEHGSINGDVFEKIMSVDFDPVSVKPAAFNQFVDSINDAARVSNWVVVYRPKSSNTKIGIDTSGQAQSNSITTARNAIDSGDFDTAHQVLNSLLENQPDSGEAYYLRGLVRGFLNQFTLSDDDFAKAESLGYSEY